MTFKYSICHPNNEKIEYRNNPISSYEVLKIANDYPWKEQLNLIISMDQNEVHYSPSLDFICIENGQSFCLTAHFDNNKELQFSIWYNRPKKVKILFGLLGEKSRMVVDDYWSLDFDKSMDYLNEFVNGNYRVIEKLYEK